MRITHKREGDKIVFYRVDYEWVDENGEGVIEDEEIAVLFLKDEETAKYVEENMELLESLKANLFEIETNARITDK